MTHDNELKYEDSYVLKIDIDKYYTKTKPLRNDVWHYIIEKDFPKYGQLVIFVYEKDYFYHIGAGHMVKSNPDYFANRHFSKENIPIKKVLAWISYPDMPRAYVGLMAKERGLRAKINTIDDLTTNIDEIEDLIDKRKKIEV